MSITPEEKKYLVEQIEVSGGTNTVVLNNLPSDTLRTNEQREVLK
jgi:hypothetical protein